MVAIAGWSQEFSLHNIILIHVKLENISGDQPTIATTMFSEEVLNSKDLEHILSRIWCKLRENWDSCF